MNRYHVLPLPFLLLLLAGCDDNGYPNTDVEAIMFGLVFIAVAVSAAFCFWVLFRR